MPKVTQSGSVEPGFEPRWGGSDDTLGIFAVSWLWTYPALSITTPSHLTYPASVLHLSSVCPPSLPHLCAPSVLGPWLVLVMFEMPRELLLPAEVLNFMASTQRSSRFQPTTPGSCSDSLFPGLSSFPRLSPFSAWSLHTHCLLCLGHSRHFLSVKSPTGPEPHTSRTLISERFLGNIAELNPLIPYRILCSDCNFSSYKGHPMSHT